MISENLPGRSPPGPRSLKIEETGDFSANNIKPKIRLMGRWLQQAGFAPGERVRVVCLGPGVIELRSPVAANPPPPSQTTWKQASLALG